MSSGWPGYQLNWRLLGRRLGLISFMVALSLYALWPWLPWARGVPSQTLVVYGFSILGEVMNEGIFPAFQDEWAAQTGERVEFVSAFAGSGTVTNQVVLGVPAQVAILSTELDALRLVRQDVLPGPTWRDLPFGGVVNRTPFIILVRPGNPRQITDFNDLGRPDIGVVHPDPLTSGGAQWAILAEYGAGLRQSGDASAATEQLRAIWRRVVAQAASARSARTQFENGFGDALITYEQEAIFDRARDRLAADLVYPPRTILSEHTVVVIDRNIRPQDRELVDAFVAFLWSERAQLIFVAHGFRSVDEELNQANSAFGPLVDPFTVQDLGGWERAKADIIDGIWQRQILPEIGR